MIPEPYRTHVLDLLLALGPAADSFVLAGAQAMKFSLRSARATRDFDFVLDVLALQENSDAPIAQILHSLGYEPVPEARLFQFEKVIPGAIERMRIEFMAPSAHRRKSDIRVDIQEGVHGRACVGGHIVLAESDVHEISGSLSDGRAGVAKIRVARPHALVMLKLFAMDDRYRNLRGSAHYLHDRDEATTHAADLVSIVAAQEDFPKFRAAFQNQFQSDAELEHRAVEILRDYFRGDRAPGPVLYGEFLANRAGIERDTETERHELRHAIKLLHDLL